MKHTHDIQKTQLWVALAEIATAIGLVVFAGLVFYLAGLSK